MSEGCQRLRKASASTSAALSASDRAAPSGLETGRRVRSAGVPVLWGTEPHQVYPHSAELHRIPVVLVA